MNRLVVPLFAALSVAGAIAQPATSFEVASVKPAASPSGAPMVRMRGCRPDPGGLNCTGTTLKELIADAYAVKGYQVEGPAWIDSEPYDIVAKMPAGSTKEQQPAMIQALLADRFKLVFHRETKPLSVLDLTVAKGGAKIKELDAAALAAPPRPPSTDPTGPPIPPPPPGAPPGPGGRAAAPTYFIRMGTNGAFIAGRLTIPQLIGAISRAVDRPIVDATGLKGTYQIELTFMPDDGAPMWGQIRAAAAGSGVPPAPPEPNAPVASLYQALQQTLGLKLEPRKSPFEVLVIDSANKVPTGN